MPEPAVTEYRIYFIDGSHIDVAVAGAIDAASGGHFEGPKADKDPGRVPDLWLNGDQVRAIVCKDNLVETSAESASTSGDGHLLE